MSAKTKPRPSGRASIPTPPVKFADDDLSVAKKKHSKVKGSAAQRSRLSWLIAFASRVGIFYVLFAAVWSCPSRPFAFDYGIKDSRPVCRNIAQTYQQAAPVITPYVQLAQSKIEPYSRPVVHFVSPVVNRAYKISRPVVRETTKRGKLIWKKRIEPARKRALKHANKRVQPYVQRADAYYAQKIQPHVNTAHKTLKPYHDMYQRDVAPYVNQAYQYSLQSSSVTYAFYMDRLHPHVTNVVKQVYSFMVNHVDPAVRRAYSLYIRPQLEKILQKVYERKAHYLGSDAIKLAQSDMKHAAKMADQNAKSAIRKAEQEAIRAQSDPTLADRVKQARDAVVGGHRDEIDPIKIAKLDAELEVEEAKVREQLEVWESGMSDLIEKEYRISVERLAELRNRRLADLPDRFGLLNEAFVEDQVALILNRIERGTKKLASGVTDANKSDRLASATNLVRQQLAKFDDLAEDTKVQISGFYEELLQQERQTVEASSQELRRYAEAAEQAYNKIIEDIKFSSTMDDWEGWSNGVKKRAALFSEELYAVQNNKKTVRASSGAPDLRSEAPDLEKEIQALRKQADSLHKSARKEVASFGNTALAQLAGEGVMAKVSDVMDRVSQQASQISNNAAAGMMAAVDAARGRLGLGESTDDSYIARAKAFVSSSDSGLVDGYVDSFTNNAQSGINSASSAVSQASRSIASAVGATPSAEGYVDGLTDSLKSATDSALSLASQASKSAASVVGAEPTPSGLLDYVDAFNAKVESAVDGAVDGAASASSYASSALSQAGQNAASAFGAESTAPGLVDYVDAFNAKVESVVDGALDRAASASSVGSSVLREATRSAASVLGASPTPETFFDYVELMTDSAGSIASSISIAAASGSSYVASAASEASRAAGQNANSASSAASSLVSQASDSASSAVLGASSSVVSANSYASSVVSKATRSAKSAVGASPTPETLEDYTENARDSFNSAVNYVAENAGSANAYASSVVSQATRSAKSAAGASQTPESLSEYIEDSKDTISSAINYVADAASSASSVAASGAKKAAEQAHFDL